MAGVGMKMNADRFFRKTGKMLSHIQNTRPLMKAIGEMSVSSTRERFRREEGPDGEKWKKSQRAQDQGGQTLTDTAKLKNSIQYEAGNDTVMVGTNDIRAAIHQFGGDIKPKTKKALNTPFGPRGKVTMPARPFIGFSDDDIEEAKDLTRKFIAKGLK